MTVKGGMHYDFYSRYFITTDDKILKKRQEIENIHVMSPVEFVNILEEE